MPDKLGDSVRQKALARLEAEHARLRANATKAEAEISRIQHAPLGFDIEHKRRNAIRKLRGEANTEASAAGEVAITINRARRSEAMSDTLRGRRKKGGGKPFSNISSDKAHLMLEEGTAHGRKLTKKQRGALGARLSEKRKRR